MKNFNILLLFFVLSNISLNGQINNFYYLNYSSEWRIVSSSCGFFGECQTSYITEYFDGDTIIGGMSYYKKYQKIIDTTTSIFTNQVIRVNQYTNGPLFVREDSIGNFWQYYPSFGTSLIFDNLSIRGLAIGDTSRLEYNCLVDSLGYVTMANRQLKQVFGSFRTANGAIEGIGKIDFLCGMGIEGNSVIYCYTKDGTTLQFGNIPCSSFPIPVRRNRISGIQANETFQPIKIYPNPVSSLLNLDLQTSEPVLYAIYNTLGIEIKSGQSTEAASSIDVSTLTSGIYTLKVTYKGISSLQKFIKI